MSSVGATRQRQAQVLAETISDSNGTIMKKPCKIDMRRILASTKCLELTATLKYLLVCFTGCVGR